MAETIDFVFRDFNTPGLPGSGEYEPEKPRIRRLLRQIQGGSGQSVTAPTLAALQAITPPAETYLGIVLNDPDPTVNGYYYREDGEWVYGRGFPDTFAEMVLTGGASSQVGVVDAGVNPADVEIFWADVQTENDGPLLLNGIPVLNLAGNPLAAGEWTGVVLFVNSGDHWQLIIDAGAAASAAQSASEAAQDAAAAELARIAAEAAASSVSPTEYPNIATAQALTPASAPDFIRTAGYSTAGDGGGALYKKVATEPTHAGKFSITLDDGVTVVWYEISQPKVPAMAFGAGNTADDTADLLVAIDCVAALGQDFALDLGGATYRISAQIDTKGTRAISSGCTFEHLNNAAQIRLRARSQWRGLYTSNVPANFTGSALLIYGDDTFGTMDYRTMCENWWFNSDGQTGTAVHFLADGAGQLIDHVMIINPTVRGFEHGIRFQCIANDTAGVAFINGNQIIRPHGGGGCLNFITLEAATGTTTTNFVNQNAFIVPDFQANAGTNRALHLENAKYNSFVGMSLFDLAAADQLYVDGDSTDNYLQGIWIPAYQNISPTNTVINQASAGSRVEVTRLNAKRINYRGYETFADGDTTPSVEGGSAFKTANTAGTVITNFDQGGEGHLVTVIAGDANTTIANNANFRLIGTAANMRLIQGVPYTFLKDGTVWRLLNQINSHAGNLVGSDPTGSSVFSANANPLGKNAGFIQMQRNDGSTIYLPYWTSITP